MRTPRPLQVPGKVRIAHRLDALFSDIGYPLRVEPEPGEGIGLEDTEGNQSCQPAGDQADEDENPIVSVHSPVIGEGVMFSLVLNQIPKDQRRRKDNRQRCNVDLRCHCHSEGETEADTQKKQGVCK